MSEIIRPVVWDSDGPSPDQAIYDDFVLNIELPLPEEGWMPPSTRPPYGDDRDDIVLWSVPLDDIKDLDD